MNAVLTRILSVALCGFTLFEVNYPQLTPMSQLAIFAMLGLVLCFLNVSAHPSVRQHAAARAVDLLLAALTVIVCAYIVVQTEPRFAGWWTAPQSLGNRAGYETTSDILAGTVGLVIVLEATRRTIGLSLVLLSVFFLAYAYWGAWFPDWFFPHRGYSASRIVAQAFLQAQGVFGVALSVMFTYVFLFIILGVLLELTGATRFIINLANRTFRGSSGGPAKVGVFSAGLMGSVSGSAVANTATCGAFTIPMMRTAGFTAETAAGIQAAASSGGALMPPVMGAAAYMMLEIVDPPVTYLEVIRAAFLPALIYYLSLFLIVHFYARRTFARGVEIPVENAAPSGTFEGVIFFGSLGVLLALLLFGYTPFRAVTVSLGVIVALSFVNRRTRMSGAALLQGLVKAARDGVPLIAASAAVGIIIGIVTLTGVGTRFPAALLPLAEESLFLALVIIMVSSIVLGMGLPSTVCYLLLATLVGPVLGQLGVIPLAGHFFIFYFGMMSMVTPPVALAGYAAASIAGTPVMRTSMAAFRFALVGFTLPFIFVYRPQLLLIDPATAGVPPWSAVIEPLFVAVLGVTAFAAGLAAYFAGPMSIGQRVIAFVAAALLLVPSFQWELGGIRIPVLDVAGLATFVLFVTLNLASRPVLKETQEVTRA